MTFNSITEYEISVYPYINDLYIVLDLKFDNT